MTGLLERAIIGLCGGTPILGEEDLKSRVKIGMNSFVSEKNFKGPTNEIDCVKDSLQYSR